MEQRDDWHLTDVVEHELGRGDPFAAAVRATRMAMVITDPTQADNPIIFCNEAFQKLTGYAREEVLGRNCRFLQGSDTDAYVVAQIRAAVDGGRDISVDLLNYRKDGTTFWNALYMSPVRDDVGVIQFFFASQLDVTERVEAQRMIVEQKAIVDREVEARTRDLEAALEAKTLLLHEVDHRVKNNLTMIGALIRLQSRAIANPVLTDKLESMLERVDALATVHRRLYQSDDVSRFDIGAFTENLVVDVVGASGRDDIELDMICQEVQISSSKAAALGLVINEVATNAIKHGFKDGRTGKLTVRCSAEEGNAKIILSDDGPGCQGLNDASGMGRTLIERLTRQVGGRATWAGADPGCAVSVEFPVDDK